MPKNGSQDALVELIERHRGVLFKIAGAYCKNPAIAAVDAARRFEVE